MFLTILTFLSAISISVIAAGYSILGLATLFAGAYVPIIAMGSALEVGKLVAASWLYHNWRRNIPKSLKAYLFTSIIGSAIGLNDNFILFFSSLIIVEISGNSFNSDIPVLML